MIFDKTATNMLFDYLDEVAKKLGYINQYYQLTEPQQGRVDSVVMLHVALLTVHK